MVDRNTEPANTLSLVVVDTLSALSRSLWHVNGEQQTLAELLIESLVGPLRGHSSRYVQ